jgi:uncharacterized protein HemY
MKNVETTLTSKEVNVLVNMVNQQITVLQMTDNSYFTTDSYKSLTSMLDKLKDLNLNVSK